MVQFSLVGYIDKATVSPNLFKEEKNEFTALVGSPCTDRLFDRK